MRFKELNIEKLLDYQKLKDTRQKTKDKTKNREMQHSQQPLEENNKLKNRRIQMKKSLIVTMFMMLIMMISMMGGIVYAAGPYTDGTSYYDTLLEAFTNAPNGSTITVLRDVVDSSGPVELAAGKTLTLDLGNYTIEKPQYSLMNKGNLTIKGEGHLELTGGYSNSNQGGTLTINGGMFSSGGCWVNLSGTMTINDGTFIGNDWVIANVGTLNINGGSFNSVGKNNISNQGTGTITISNATINSVSTTSEGAIWTEGTGTITIKSGTITDSGSKGAIVQNSTGKVIIGTNDSSVSSTSPLIRGNKVYSGSQGTVEFYDGILQANSRAEIFNSKTPITSSITEIIYGTTSVSGKTYYTATLKKTIIDPPTAPTITAKLANGNNYSSGAWANQRINITLSSTSVDSEIAKYQYKEGTGSWTDLTDNTAYFEGERNTTVYFRAIDRESNIGSESSIKIKIDKTAPSAPSITATLAKGGTYTSGSWAKGRVNITLESTDGGSGISKYQAKEGNGSWKDLSDATDTFAADRNSTVYFRVIDKAENVSAESSIQIAIDTTAPTAPTITATKASGGIYTSGSLTAERINVTLSSTDSVSGIGRYQYKEGNGSWTDLANNTTYFESEKNTTVYFRAVDKGGNISSESSIVIRIDKTGPTAPTITAKLADGTTYTSGSLANQRINITLSSTDSGVGSIAKYQCKYGNGSWTDLSDNTDYFAGDRNEVVYFRAVDTFGNIGPESSIHIYLQNPGATAPTITAKYEDGTTYVSGSWSNRLINITLYSTSPVGSITKYQYKENNGSWTDLADNTDYFIGERNSTIYYRAIDSTGKAGAESTIQIAIDKTNPPAPSMSAVLASGGTYTSGSWAKERINITLSSTDDRSGISRYQYKEGNGSWAAWSGTTDYFEAERNTTVYFRAIDNAENISSESSMIIRIDNSKPTGSVTFNKTATNDGLIIVTANASDTNGIRAIQYPTWSEVNGQDDLVWHESTTSNGTGYTVNLKNHAPGTEGLYNIHVYAIDNAGNSSCIGGEEIIYDTTAPTISATVGNDSTISISITDSYSGTVAWGVTTGTTAPTTTASNSTTGNTLNKWYTVTSTTSTVNATFTGLGAGTYYAWGKDRAGNTKYTQFTIEGKEPILMAEAYSNAITNKYILGNSTSGIVRSQVNEITIETTIPANISNYINWDVSKEGNGSVMAYLVPNGTLDDGTEAYHLHIAGNGGNIKASNGSYLFYGYRNCTEINGLENLDTSDVNSMYYMFTWCEKLTSLNVRNFNTSNVRTMYSMFHGCESLNNLDVSDFDTSNVETMYLMFYGCKSLNNLDVSNFDTSNVADMMGMFRGCSSLTSLDLSSFDTSAVTNMSYMFYNCSSLTSLNLSSFNTSNVINMSYMFDACSGLTSLDLSNFNTSKVTNMGHMFILCENLTTLDLSSFNTSSVIDMSYMFDFCRNLTSLDLTNFDTSSATNMNYMFYQCESLTSIKLGKNFTKLNGVGMFYNINKAIAIIPEASTPMIITDDTGAVVTNGLNSSTKAVIYVPNATVESDYEDDNNYASLLGFTAGSDSARIKPILGLYGEQNIEVGQGGTYDESATVAGFKSVTGADITPAEVKCYGYVLTQTSNNVDLSTQGEYQVTYKLTLDGEKVDEITRNVTVKKVNPILMEETYANAYTNKYILGNSTSGIVRNQVNEITIETTIPANISNYINWDVSKEGNGSVMAYLVPNGTLNGTQMYHLHIAGNGGNVKATSGDYLFAYYTNCTAINGLDKLDTSAVTGMYQMFYSCSSLTSLNVSGWNTGAVTNMNYMFGYCSSLANLDVSDWNTGAATNMNYMFYYCSSLTNIFLGQNFDRINGSRMFSGISKLTTIISTRTTPMITTDSNGQIVNNGLGNLNTILYVPNATVESAYENDSNYANLLGFEIGSDSEGIEPILGLYGSQYVKVAQGASYTDVATVAGFNSIKGTEITPPQVKEYGYVLTQTSNNVNTTTLGDYTITYKLQQNGVDVDTITRYVSVVSPDEVEAVLMAETEEESYYLLGASRYDGDFELESLNKVYIQTITILDLKTDAAPRNYVASWDMSRDYNSSVTAWLVEDSNTTGIYHLYIGGNGKIKVTSGYYLFAWFTGCTNIYGLDNLDTSEATDMQFMFYACERLTSLDLNGLETSLVTNMTGMFAGCGALESLDVSDFDTSSVVDMSGMFFSCTNLKSIDVSNFDTSNVIAMSSTFAGCTSLTNIDVSNFDTSSVMEMSYLFGSCTSLTNIDVSNFDTSSVESMYGMFSECENLEVLNLSNFDTSLVYDMDEMFYNCSSLKTLNLNSFDTSSVEYYMTGMFEDCDNLTKIYLGENFDKIIGDDMFCNTPKLTTIISSRTTPMTASASNGLMSGTEGANTTAVIYVPSEAVETAYEADSTYASLLGFEVGTDSPRVEAFICNYSVNGTYYETLADAVAAITTTGTIIVEEDYVDSSYVEIAAGKNIILDTNGKTITKVTNNILNKGKLIITGAGIIEAQVESKPLIESRDLLTIDDVRITADKVNASSVIHINNGALEMNGGTIEAIPAVMSVFDVVSISTGDFTMNDGSIKALYSEDVEIGCAINTVSIKGTLVMNDGEIINENIDADSAYNHAIINNGSVIINDGLVDSVGDYGIISWADENTSTVIKGGTITGAKRAVRIYEGNSLTIGTKDANVSRNTPVLISDQYAVNSAVAFNFYDGILKGKTAGYNGTIADVEGDYEVVTGIDGEYKTAYLKKAPTLEASDVSINQGATTTVTATYNGDGTLSAVAEDVNVVEVSIAGNTVTIKGLKTGSTSITVNATEGDEYAPKSTTFTVTVKSGNYSVNGTYYETLKEAVAAIDTTGTIIVEKDYTDSSSVTIPSEKNITIDTNGKTITKVSAGSLYGITNNGNLTIDGEGTIQTDILDNNKLAILVQNNGTLTVKSGALINKGCIGSHFRTIQGGDINIEGGVIKACVEGIKTTTTSGNPRTINIENGTLNISGGEIIADGKPLAFAIESYATASEFNGTINFSDGKINSSGYGIVILGKKPDHLLLNMTGGEINSVEVGVYGGGNSVGAIAIKDGTIISKNNCGVYNEGSAICTIGTDDTNVSATNPIIIGATEAVVSANGFTFYDGIVKGAEQAVEVETVNEIPEGYEVVNGTEKINGIDYDVAYLKLTPKFTVEPTNIELNRSETGIVTITYDGDGTLSVVPEDDSVATVSISENVISIIGEKEGTTTVTVNAAESDEYAPKSTTFTVTVKLISIAQAKVALSQTLYAYDGAPKEPVATVTLDGKVLVKDTDYTVTYQDNAAIGTATVVITGINNYKGTAKEYFIISSNTTDNDQIIVDLQAPTISNVVGLVDGSKVTVTATIEDPIITETIPGRGVNASETRYAITDTATAPTADSAAWQSSNVFTISDVSTVYLWIKAVDNVGNVSISTELSSVKVTKDINDLEVSLSETTYTYDGNAKTPTVTVKDGDVKLTLNTDYTVSYKDNVNAGTATVTVTGKGYYTGSVDVTFTIEKADATLVLDKTTISVNPGDGRYVGFTYIGDGIVNVSSADDGIATATKVGNSIMITGVTAGTTTVTISVSDEKNYNPVDSQTITVFVQARPTAPIISVTNSDGAVASGEWSNEDLRIEVSGSTISGPGEIGYKYSYDGNVWYEANGWVRYSIDTKDGIIYAKAYNKSSSNLESEIVSYDIRLDKTAPTGVTIETTATTSTITLNVTSVNANVSGLKEYEFYLDGVLKATQTGSSYTFTGLSAGVTYTVGVKVRDNAGNVTELVTKTQSTNEVSGEIILTPDKTAWTNTDVVVTIEWPSTTLIKQIKVGNGEWQNYSDTSYTVTANTTISARLTDGSNHGSAVSLEIDNIDKNAPTVSTQSSVVYGNSVTLTIADVLSGVDGWQVTENNSVPTSGWTTIAATTNTTVTYKPTKVDTYYAWVKDQAGNVSAYAMFDVTAKDISTSSDISADLNEKVFTYDGTAKTPSATVKDGTTELKAGTDYDITYSNNINAGTATATIAGKGNYSGTITLNFTINKATSVLTLNPTSGKTAFGEENSFSVKSNTDGKIDVTSGNVTYVEIVSGNGANLLAETPSSVTYSGAKATTTAVIITVAFTPADTTNYTTATETYTVTEVSKSMPTLAANPDSVTVTVGSSEKVTITYDGDGTITATSKDGTIVTIDKSSNEITVTGVKAGSTEIEVTVSEGTNHESKTITVPVTVVSKSIASSDVKASLSETTYTYDGRAKTPTVTIVDETRGKTLKENTDYTVSYQNNIEAGTATVVITGKGDYDGTITLSFTINQATASLTVSPETLNITVGGNGTATITYVGDGTVSAISASTAIANVSKNGDVITVSGVSVGTTTVTVSATAGKNYTAPASKTINVNVCAAPTTAPTITVKNSDGVVANGDWSNKDLTITISGSSITGAGEVGYKYSYDGTTWYEYTNAITYATEIRDGVIYAKAYNKLIDTLESANATHAINVDKTAPKNIVLETSTTTNTVTIAVSSVDASIAGVKEYEFYLNGELKATQTSASYTFIELDAESDYTVGVKVRDNAGNVTELTTASVTTEAVSGIITLTPDKTTWTNTDVIVTIGWPESTLTKQIKIGNGNWQNYSETTYTITENTTISARLSDGINHGDAVSLEIDNIDKEDPRVSLGANTYVYGTSLNLSMQDSLSGVNAYVVTSTSAEPTTGWNTISVIKNGSLGIGIYPAGKYFIWVKDQAGNISDYFEVTITAKNLTSTDITAELEQTTFIYDGNPKTPNAIVKDGTTELKVGIDYTIAYSNNTNVGTATATITGKNNYTGTLPLEFNITKTGITPTVNMSDYTYGGTVSVPSINGNTSNGTVTYYYNETNSTSGGAEWKNITPTALNVGTYYMYAVVDETANYNGATTPTKEFKVVAKSLSSSSVNVTVNEDPEGYTYDGKPKTPEVIVKDGIIELVVGSDYTVEYKDNINAGTATITVTGMGNYAGSVDRTFVIRPAAPIITLEEKETKYTGSPIHIDEAMVEGQPNGDEPNGEVTYTYYIDADRTNLTNAANSGAQTEGGAPVNVGTYYVRATIAASGNYSENVSNTVKLIIIGAPTTPVITIKDSNNVIEEGEWAIANVTIVIDESELVGEGTIKYQYSIDNGNWTEYTGAFSYTTETKETIICARAYNEKDETMVSDVATRILKLDKTAPTDLTITAITENGVYENGWINKNVSVTFTANDSISEISHYLYSVNGGEWNTGANTSFDYSGEFTLKVKAINNAGLESQPVEKLIKLDKDVPEVTGVTASGVTGRTEEITVLARDTHSGVEKYALTKNAVAPDVSDTTAWQDSNVFTVSENATWYAWVIDGAGNISEKTANSVVTNSNVDRNPIKIEASIYTTNESGIYAKVGDTITLKIKATKEIGVLPRITIAGQIAIISDAQPGKKEYTASVVVNNATPEGTVGFEITEYADTIGNEGADVTETIDDTVVYVDRTLPTITKPEVLTITENTIVVQSNQKDTASKVFNSGIVKTEYAFKESTQDNWSGWQTSETLEGLALGTSYDIMTRATDAAGNVSISEVLPNVITTMITAGDIELVPDYTEWVNIDVTVTIHWPETTLNKYYREDDGEWQLVDSSAAQTKVVVENYGGSVTAKLADENVNEVTNSITIFNIDKIKPTLEATVQDKWTNTPKVISVTSEDSAPTSGIAGYYLTTDKDYVPTFNEFVAKQSYVQTYTKEMGTYYIWVADNAKNICEKPAEVVVKNIEKEKPVITLVGVSDNIVSKEDSIVITFKATDNNADMTTILEGYDLEIFVGNNIVVPTEKTLTTTNKGNEIIYELTLGGLIGDGEVSIVIPAERVTDIAGNTNDETTLTTNVTVDNSAPEKPVVTVTPEGEVVGGDVTITITPVPGEDYEYSTDGGETWQEVPDDNKIIIDEEGDTEVLIKATDEAGNESEETEVNVRIDITDPVLDEENIILPNGEDGNPKDNVKDGDTIIIEIPVIDENDVILDPDKIIVTVGGEEITPDDITLETEPGTGKPTITITIVVDENTEGEILVEIEEGAITDVAGNEVAPEIIETGVEVDNTKPVVTITPPEGEYKSGDEITYVIEITEENSYEINEEDIEIEGGAIKDIIVNDDGTVEVIVIVGAGDGNVTIIVEEGFVTDAAGNTNDIVSDTTVIVDNTPPVLNGATINNGSAVTDGVGVTVQIDAIDADWMFITNENVTLSDVTNLSKDAWMPYANETLHELTQGDGEKTVYVWVKDNAGNIIGPAMPSITLNATTIGNKEDKVVENGIETTTSTGNNNTVVKFKVTDENFYNSVIESGMIVAFVNGSQCFTATFENVNGSAITNGVAYQTIVTNVSGNGRLSLGLEGATVRDKAGNVLTTTENPVDTQIIADNSAPTLTVTTSEITVNDTNIVGVTLNGKLITTTNGTTTINVPAGSVVKAIDKAGNTTTVIK